ncbi:MAG TPA: hypothetical protein VNW92_00820, partial [Polyangiaceae bacterium]|nr:hypothetical protein [Polyangiaceae bacterium]
MPAQRKTALARRALVQAAAAGVCAALLVATSCSVDDRPLSSAVKLDSGGNGGSGSDDEAGGSGPSVDAGKGGSVSAPDAGAGTVAVSLGGAAGMNQTSSAGTSSDDGATAGSAGALPSTPCGDLDRDGVDDCAETLVE